VTVHWANNETGVRLLDDELRALVAACRERAIPVHLDAVQAPGKLAVDVAELGVDLLSLSAHKFHGPKGAGALYVRGGSRDGDDARSFAGLILGGAQEDERRAGTPNVPGLVGMGRAAELAREHVADPAACERVRELRDRLEAGLLERVPAARVNGARAPRLANTTNVRFPDLDGELLLMTLAAEGLAVSGGAACSARRRAPSHVLLAMGLCAADASRSIRLSLSRRTTAEEVETALELVPRVVAELRALEAV
jgi:cysteine desulfurase